MNKRFSDITYKSGRLGCLLMIFRGGNRLLARGDGFIRFFRKVDRLFFLASRAPGSVKNEILAEPVFFQRRGTRLVHFLVPFLSFSSIRSLGPFVRSLPRRWLEALSEDRIERISSFANSACQLCAIFSRRPGKKSPNRLLIKILAFSFFSSNWRRLSDSFQAARDPFCFPFLAEAGS